MVYDNIYFLGQVFQRFLRDQVDVLDDLRDALWGEDPVGAGASHALLGRFERWLDEQGCMTDMADRTALMQVAKAFVDLATEFEEVESLVLV